MINAFVRHNFIIRNNESQIKNPFIIAERINMYKSVTVFCGSQYGNNPLFKEEAEALGKILSENNIELIYGGGNSGLMGVIANTMLQFGGKVTGIMPQLLIRREKVHTGLTTLHEAEDMHSRKKLLYSLAEAAIVLPGGIGTLDEMFEIVTWNNLSIHNKKIILLNTAGFYNHLLNHLQYMQDEGFLYNNWRQMVTVCEHSDNVIRALHS